MGNNANRVQKPIQNKANLLLGASTLYFKASEPNFNKWRPN